MIAQPSIEDRFAQIQGYDFRQVHPSVSFGTASDRYAGWIGQIYDESWRDRIQKRRKRLGSKSYQELLVPTEAVSEYFQHFSVLELDFTFYRPLLEADGNPSTNYRVIERYIEHAPRTARFLVKAPQMYCSPHLRGVGKNDDYLNTSAYRETFQDPLAQLLGSQLRGIIFEQGYQPVKKSPPVEALVEDLDRFFEDVGQGGPQVHLEIRSGHLLQPLYFDWLETRGLGFVYSHWTWLPSIKAQWRKSGRFTSADGNVVLRLMTPLKMTYADAFDLAHPFDKPVPELRDAFSAKDMIEDSVALAYKAIEGEKKIDVVANNRAWGNAPDLAAAIARRLLDIGRRHSR